MEDPEVWSDQKRAQSLGRERKQLEDVVLVIEQIEASVADSRELFNMLNPGV